MFHCRISGLRQDEELRIHVHVLEIIQERVGDRVPVIGVGSIYSADDALKALETGVPLIALGRELIIDPEWVQKVEQGRESEIVTKINKNHQHELEIPDPLWQVIINSPGWFPGNRID